MQAAVTQQVNRLALSKTLQVLAKDAARLEGRKTPAAMRKALDKLDDDMRAVVQLTEGLIAGETPDWAKSDDKVVPIDHPVAYIRQFLAEHGNKMTRQEIIAYLKARGVNTMTARTQYYRWKQTN